jgi:hypothetical protein
MEIIGYAAALLIGVTLGLIGSGGSILTVPVLVYLLKVDPVPATAYSLFVVGLTALIGAMSYMKKGLVSYKTAAVFAIPAFIAVFATRKFIIPAIPETLFSVGSFDFGKDIFIMILFAVLMLLASISMIKDRRKESETEEISFNYPMIILEGIVVGVLTGLVGAGGGFLIIPALVLLARLPMKLAVGTSLLIIAVKSLIGFLGDVDNSIALDWTLLSVFSVLAVGGIFLGSFLTKYIEGKKLKPAFGYFVLVMGFYIIGSELVTKVL